ncbi:hypothetical protein IGJ83_003205 [Enterococcus pernyi]
MKIGEFVYGTSVSGKKIAGKIEKVLINTVVVRSGVHAELISIQSLMGNNSSKEKNLEDGLNDRTIYGKRYFKTSESS